MNKEEEVEKAWCVCFDFSAGYEPDPEEVRQALEKLWDNAYKTGKEDGRDIAKSLYG